MNTRLKQFLAAENITQAQFADNLEVVRASVSHILSGRNNPGYDFIKALMSKYPRLNIEWLIFGKGRMYKDTQSAQTEERSQSESLPSNTLFTPEIFEDHSKEDLYLAKETEEPIRSNELSIEVQTPEKQRRVSKIIILYDDGSYQEM